MEYRTNLGYVKQGCGTTTRDIVYTVVGRARVVGITALALVLSGIFFQIVFVWIVTAILLKMTFKDYAQKTFTYSYDMYGMFWGVSTTAVLLFGTLYSIHTETAYLYMDRTKAASLAEELPLLCGLFSSLVVELPVAIYIARKATVAVPCIFKYPATLLCCGGKRPAERLVTTIVLWVNLVVLQLILFQGIFIVFVIPAAPFAIASDVMLIVLGISCLTNIFSLLYTVFAHLCTPSNQQVHSSSMVLRAVVVLPLLLMIMCHGIVFASMGLVTNVDAKRNNALSFISSIATTVLLGVLSVFLKKFISAWLKWSPQGTEQVNNSSNRHGVDEELLGP